LFEQDGVMNKTKLITEMNLLLYRHLKGIDVITDGMIPKIDLGFSALKGGVKQVSIRNFKHVQQSKSGTSLIS
jgi:acetylglutamate kinase